MNINWLILLSALASAGCYGNPVSPDMVSSELTPVSVSSPGQTNEVINIRFDEIVTYADLKLRWLEVNDSRCPIGVNCVWAGEVKVLLEATRAMAEGNMPVEVQLTLHARPKPSTASVFCYELELLNVDPHPKDGVTPERGNYVAKIKFSNAVVRPGRDQQSSIANKTLYFK